MGILSLGLTIYSLWVLGTDSVSNLLLSLPAKCMDPSLKPPGGLMSRKGKFLPCHHRSLGHPVFWNAATSSCDDCRPAWILCQFWPQQKSPFKFLCTISSSYSRIHRTSRGDLYIVFCSIPLLSLPRVPTIPRFLFTCLTCPPSSSK